MDNILNEVIEKLQTLKLINIDILTAKLQTLKLINIDILTAKKVVTISINSVKNYILFEINNNINFLEIREIFIDIVIGEYLSLIKNANLDENMNFENAIKSISEGDVSISYFQRSTSEEDKLKFLIQYFLSKKNLLLNFKVIRW